MLGCSISIWVAQQWATWDPSNCWPVCLRVGKALSKIKYGKAAGQSGNITEMLKAIGDEGVAPARQMKEVVVSCSMIHYDWEESFILNLFKGKGGALDHGNYHDLKLTDQIVKLLEQVIFSYVCEMVNIGKMQLGFVPGRGTIYATFVVCQLHEKYISANKC